MVLVVATGLVLMVLVLMVLVFLALVLVVLVSELVLKMLMLVLVILVLMLAMLVFRKLVLMLLALLLVFSGSSPVRMTNRATNRRSAASCAEGIAIALHVSRPHHALPLAQVWDDRGPGHLRFDSEGGGGGTGKGALGFITEHGVIHSALFERAQELEEAGLAELMCPAQARKAISGNTNNLTAFGAARLILTRLGWDLLFRSMPAPA